MWWRRNAPEFMISALATALYIWACCSVVVCKGLSAGPFDLAAINGFSCVLLGWMDYPFGWLANPLIFIGIVLLLCRRSRAAVLCGLFALIAVMEWSWEWDRQGTWPMLREGYFLWVASVAVLTVGSAGVWVVRSRSGPSGSKDNPSLPD